MLSDCVVITDGTNEFSISDSEAFGMGDVNSASTNFCKFSAGFSMVWKVM